MHVNCKICDCDEKCCDLNFISCLKLFQTSPVVLRPLRPACTSVSITSFEILTIVILENLQCKQQCDGLQLVEEEDF